MDGELTRLPVDDSRWQAFVTGRREATPLQSPAWSAFLSECYDFKSFVLAAETDDRIVAGVPVIEVRRPLGARRWISLPFTDECNVLGDMPSWFPRALDDARRASGVVSHEIRGPAAGASRWSQGYVHRLVLAPGLDAITRAYRSSVRQGIRVAEREGVAVRFGDDPADLVETFYGLHVRTRRRLGVPVQRRRYFRLLWERIIAPGGGFVLVAEHRSTPVAAAVFLQSASTVLYKYGASDDRHWKLRANNALFQTAIARAVGDGAEVFDWGRTDFADEGLRRFKAGWGSEETELAYSILGRVAPTTRRSNGGLTRSIIRHSPAAVSRIAGALLYRYAA